MGLQRWFSNSQPNGTSVSLSNFLSSPSALQPVVVSAAGGSTLKYSNLHPHSGGLGLEVFAVSGSNSQVRLPLEASNNLVAVEFYDYINGAIPSTAEVICSVRHASGNICKIATITGGRLQQQDSTGGPLGTTFQTATGIITANTLLRYSVLVNVSTGFMSTEVYLGDSTTPLATLSNTVAGSLGSNPVVSIDIGRPNTTAQNVTQYFDVISIQDGSSSRIGPYTVTNAPPTSNAGADQYGQPRTYNLAGTIDDVDGTIPDFANAWQWVSGPLASSASGPSIASGRAGAGTNQLVCTASIPLTAGKWVFSLGNGAADDGGSTIVAPDTMTCFVSPASGDPVQVYDTVLGTYTNVGGASNATAALNDANDATYVESVPAPVSPVLDVILCPIAAPGNITFNAKNVNSPGAPAISVTADLTKNDGSTVIYTTNFVAPTSIGTNVITVDASGLAAVPDPVDRGALHLKFKPLQ